MYFPNAFRKDYLAKPTAGGAIDYIISGNTSVLTAGQFGLFLTPNGIIGNAIASGTTQTLTLAMGSWNTVDSIAPFYGGMKESWKSKMINPKYVNRFMKVTAQAAQNQIISIGWNQSSGSTVGPLFYCGTNYSLRVEGKGSPALWTLNKQLYTTLDAWGGCCGTDCSSGCTSTTVDAGSIMLQWKDRITQSPILPSFYTPAVFIKNGSSKTQIYSAYDTSIGVGTGTYVPNTADPASVIAALQLTVAYAETKFGSCTFTPTDHYEIEPLIVYTSLVNQDASPCAYNTTINTSVPNMVAELQAPRQVRGLGEVVLRNLIMGGRYHQDDFPDNIYVDSLRMREIQDDVNVPNVVRSALYDQIVILHSVPRKYNPTGTMDSDQYMIVIELPTGTTTTAFTTLFQSCLTLANSDVTLETL